MVGSDVLTTN